MNVPFFYGRRDNKGTCNLVTGRQPDALAASLSTTQGFFTKMSLTIDEVVTLLGAHSVGHMSVTKSGFGDENAQAILEGNSWDDTPHVLDNHYYLELVNKPWDLQPATAAHKQDYADRGSQRNGNAHVMLNADMGPAFTLTPPAGSPFVTKMWWARKPEHLCS
jgi:catalase (peroxidase I)